MRFRPREPARTEVFGVAKAVAVVSEYCVYWLSDGDLRAWTGAPEGLMSLNRMFLPDCVEID